MTREPEWIREEDAVTFHAQIIRAFGGSDGIRDAGLLASALGRPRHVFSCESPDLPELAGAYAHAIVKNHPFVDGNKRVTFIAARVFLGLNGVRFDPPDTEAVVMVEGLASGEVAQEVFVGWIRKHSKAAKRRKR